MKLKSVIYESTAVGAMALQHGNALAKPCRKTIAPTENIFRISNAWFLVS